MAMAMPACVEWNERRKEEKKKVTVGSFLPIE